MAVTGHSMQYRNWPADGDTDLIMVTQPGNMRMQVTYRSPSYEVKSMFSLFDD